MNGRNSDYALLQVDDDQGNVGVDFSEWHVFFPFELVLRGTGGFHSGGYLACFLVNRTLNMVLIAAMPAKKVTSADPSPPEIFPARNRM
jgi:hypothetical protein